jgi:hypothetical protein
MTGAGGAGEPHTNSVVARWEGGWRCTVAAGGFDLVVDEPERSGGTGTGPMPTEYFPRPGVGGRQARHHAAGSGRHRHGHLRRPSVQQAAAVGDVRRGARRG